MGQWIERFSLLRGPEWKATEVAFCKGPALGPVCAIYSGRVPDCGSPRVIRCRYICMYRKDDEKSLLHSIGDNFGLVCNCRIMYRGK